MWENFQLHLTNCCVTICGKHYAKMQKLRHEYKGHNVTCRCEEIYYRGKCYRL